MILYQSINFNEIVIDLRNIKNDFHDKGTDNDRIIYQKLSMIVTRISTGNYDDCHI